MLGEKLCVRAFVLWVDGNFEEEKGVVGDAAEEIDWNQEFVRFRSES